MEARRIPRRAGWFAFPVTAVLSLEYGGFVILPALLKARPLSLVYTAPLVAIAVSFCVELAIRRIYVRPRERSVPSAEAGFTVALLGITAFAVKSLLGAGTYAHQTGTESTSPAASLFTPFLPWVGIGVGLIVFSWKLGGCTRRRALTFFAILVLLEGVFGLYLSGFSGQFLFVAAPIMVGCLITRTLRLRYFMLAGAILLLAWPAILQVRNEIRTASGVPVTGQSANPYARFHLDELLAYAEHIKIPSSAVPSPLEILRYGFIPRIFDRGRPDLLIGSVFSVAAGGSPENSLTFTTLGSLYAESGWLLLVAYSVLVAGGITLLLRRRTAWTFALVVASAPLLIGTEPVYPVNVIGVLQTTTSIAAAYYAIRGWATFSRRRAARRSSARQTRVVRSAGRTPYPPSDVARRPFRVRPQGFTH